MPGRVFTRVFSRAPGVGLLLLLLGPISGNPIESEPALEFKLVQEDEIRPTVILSNDETYLIAGAFEGSLYRYDAQGRYLGKESGSDLLNTPLYQEWIPGIEHYVLRDFSGRVVFLNQHLEVSETHTSIIEVMDGADDESVLTAGDHCLAYSTAEDTVIIINYAEESSQSIDLPDRRISDIEIDRSCQLLVIASTVEGQDHTTMSVLKISDPTLPQDHLKIAAPFAVMEYMNTGQLIFQNGSTISVLDDGLIVESLILTGEEPVRMQRQLGYDWTVIAGTATWIVGDRHLSVQELAPHGGALGLSSSTINISFQNTTGAYIQSFGVSEWTSQASGDLRTTNGSAVDDRQRTQRSELIWQGTVVGTIVILLYWSLRSGNTLRRS